MGSIGGLEATQGPGAREERIRVSVRLRPLNEKELARNDVSDWECINDTTVIYRSNLSASDRSLYPTAYTFDRVFRTDCPTRQVYEEGAKEVALSVVSGINTSIFAYGQTSSGKTYTMNGITKYTVADIYDYIEKHKERDFILKFSAIEIYNESVRDLLSSDSNPRRLLDDPERGTVVERLTEETLSDWNHFSELISFCEAQRQIGETSLNEASSRSHQIIRLTIESFAREFLGNDKSSSLAASVNFVDLAGSERASQTLSAGTRLKEGCHINRSLLTLGTVIRKLSKGRNGHIPFRDSKLTRILQSSLGGNARTAIICTMSPARSHVEQTRNTLLFASCAKEVATNAQVNVLMSDKALVKQLQRELARMESELRNSGSACLTANSATLLREKDLQIEKLKKEVMELTMQRDLAQSQIKDMLQVVGDDMSSIEMESLDSQYPKLRVRSSWDFENRVPEALNLSSLECLESVRSFDASQYSDGHSFSSDDNLFQLPDFEKILPRRNSSPGMSITELDAVRSELNQKDIEEQQDDNLEDRCEEVKCVLDAVRSELNQKDIEEQQDDNLEDRCEEVKCVLDAVRSELNQKHIEEQQDDNLEDRCVEVKCVLDAVSSELNQNHIEDQQDDNLEDRCEEVRCGKSEDPDLETNGCTDTNMTDLSPNSDSDSDASSPGANTATPGLTAVDDREKENLVMGSSGSKEDRELNSFRQQFVIPTPEKISPWMSESNASSTRSLKLIRSRSCKASLMMNSSSDWFEKEEIIQNTPPIGIEKGFTGRPEGFNRMVYTLNYNVNAERLSRNSSRNSVGSAAVDEVQNFKTSIDEESESNDILAPERKENADLEIVKQLADNKVPERVMEPIMSAKNFKDVGLDPMQTDGESPSHWPSEFKRLQREIVELWHACNVSLVHRTYFFLLFQGDPSDSIYMEVELRRLSYLKQTFSQDNQTVEDGRTLTPASSMRHLRRERQMLSREMQRRLSKSERENLYLKWDIRLSSKHRRLQLAHRLWTETGDMDHVRESAAIVAKLVGSVEPEQAFKEMFGLNFAPRRTRSRRSSFGWPSSMKHIL